MITQERPQPLEAHLKNQKKGRGDFKIEAGCGCVWGARDFSENKVKVAHVYILRQAVRTKTAAPEQTGRSHGDRREEIFWFDRDRSKLWATDRGLLRLRFYDVMMIPCLMQTAKPLFFEYVSMNNRGRPQKAETACAGR